MVVATLQSTATLDLLSYCYINARLPDASSRVPNSNSGEVHVRIHSLGLEATVPSAWYDTSSALEVSRKTCGILKAVSQPLPSEAKEFGRSIRLWESMSSRSENFSAWNSIMVYMATISRGAFFERFSC